MDLISSATKKLLTLSMLSGIGPAKLRKILSIPGFQDAGLNDFVKVLPPLGRVLEKTSAWDEACEAAEMQIREAARHDARIVSVLDPDYPKLLAATKDDPLLLYVRGRFACVPENSVAIIGTREPTSHGERIASRITEYFVEAGWSIVSGLAKGCDSIAHETALTNGGHTVAVLAHGLQMIYPAKNRKLAENILTSGGALVSEYPFGREISKAQYVKRDRTQAGLARGVVMVQSDLVGGSLYASRATLEYGRWLAVPYPTEVDRERDEPKIQANITISDGDNAQRSELLRCSPNSLKNVIILKSREDYAKMLDGEANDNRQAAVLPTNAASRVSSARVEANNDSPVHVTSSVNGHRTPRDLFEFSAATSRNPEILQSPSLELAKAFWVEFSSISPAITAAISARLRHLAARLEDVNTIGKMIAQDTDGSICGTYALALDDFYNHVEQGVNLLLAIEDIEKHGVSEHERDGPTECEDDVVGKSANAWEVSRDVMNFVETLVSIRESSTHRLIAAFSGDREPIENIHNESDAAPNDYVPGMTKSDLVHVCKRFNDLVRRVLYRDPAGT